ncbi:hypothetical protein D3C79_846550 [compost metagenome]
MHRSVGVGTVNPTMRSRLPSASKWARLQPSSWVVQTPPALSTANPPSRPPPRGREANLRTLILPVLSIKIFPDPGAKAYTARPEASQLNALTCSATVQPWRNSPSALSSPIRQPLPVLAQAQSAPQGWLANASRRLPNRSCRGCSWPFQSINDQPPTCATSKPSGCSSMSRIGRSRRATRRLVRRAGAVLLSRCVDAPSV